MSLIITSCCCGRSHYTAPAVPVPWRFVVNRPNIASDYVLSAENIGLSPTMTFVWYTRITGTGVTAATVVSWGWNSSTGATGAHIRYSNGTPQLLFFVSQLSGSFQTVTLSYGALAPNMNALGPHVGWATINGSALRVGIGDPAGGVWASGALGGAGVQPAALLKAAVGINYHRGDTQQSLAGDIGVAVLGETLTDPTLAALSALGEQAPVSAIDLAAVPLWYPRPAQGLNSGSVITVASEIPDYAANLTDTLSAGVSPLTVV
jgi:hypothetical protein